MKKGALLVSAKPRRKKQANGKYTRGADTEKAMTGKKEYYVAQNLDLTPHKNKPIRSVLARPLLGPNYKYMTLEGSLTGSEVSSTAFTALVNNSQGTTDSTRVGDRIKVRRYRLCAKLVGGTAATGPVAARVMLISWIVPGVGLTNFPITGMIIQAGAGRYPLGGYARDYADQFQVLHDSLHSVQPFVSSVEADFIFVERDCLIEMEFAAAATAPMVNAPYLNLITDITTAANTQPTISYNLQLLYEDNDA